MKDDIKYYVVKKKALPEVLLNVVKVNRMMEFDKTLTVQKATDAVGISRSAYYKYKEDIFPFHENVRGRTFTLMLGLEDLPGLLSNVLNHIARYHANILTIHQAIPVNGIASLTLSVDVLPETGDIAEMVDAIEQMDGVQYMKIIARE